MNLRPDKRVLIIGALLLGLTILIYAPVVRFEFINFDDPHYVTGNDFVKDGLSWANVKRAFTGAHSSNWHPLTWISHMVDCQLFGLKSGPHHVVNVLFHAVNAVLLFLVLRQMTATTWRSAAVAALFAFHPLRVESVAWISERKDVLSGFFFLLTVWSYALYVRANSDPGKKGKSWCYDPSRLYILSLLFFACGLMSKPMLVTVPFLLLLLDVWPLGRVTSDGWRVRGVVGRLLMEKVPFLLLAFISCVVTFIAQRNDGAVRSISEYSLSYRFGNSLMAYGSYLRKTFWPSDLAIFYPHQPLVNWQVAGVVLLLVVICFMVVKHRAKHPYLAVGWFWFLGTLVPVIGIVQVGEQALADRYTYLPSMGLFMALVWVTYDVGQRFPRVGLLFLKGVGAIGIGVCGLLTFGQLQHWRTSELLFAHAIKVTKNNFLAMNNLSTELIQRGRSAEAEKYLVEAVRLRPQFHDAHLSLGNVFALQGRLAEARTHFLEALKILPDSESALFNLGNICKNEGNSSEAMMAYSEVLKINPHHADAHSNLALLLVGQGKMQEAATHYQQVVQLRPENADAHFNFATAQLSLNDLAGAEEHYRIAVLLKPDFARAHLQLARILLQRGVTEEGREHLLAAVQLDPNLEDAQKELSALLPETR